MYTPWACTHGETIKPKKDRKSVPPETKIGFTRIKSVDNVIENMRLCVDLCISPEHYIYKGNAVGHEKYIPKIYIKNRS
jgi:hypothetical protein